MSIIERQGFIIINGKADTIVRFTLDAEDVPMLVDTLQ
jgi:hypothetical protein